MLWNWSGHDEGPGNQTHCKSSTHSTAEPILRPTTLILRQGLPLNLELANSTTLAMQQTLGSASLSLPSLGLQMCAGMFGFLHGCSDSSLGLPTYATSTLPAEQLPQLCFWMSYLILDLLVAFDHFLFCVLCLPRSVLSTDI